MSTTVISANGIGKSFGPDLLWEGVDLVVERGASLALTGPSGCGKSTLVRCLGLLERVDTGRVEILGEDVTHVRSARRSQLYRSTIGHLFQNGALEDTWTVRQNLDVAFIGSTIPRSERAAARRDALAQVGITVPEGSKTHTLSGGERQRLAIARLLIRCPPVVLADEPTAALDVTTGSDVLQRLAELRDAGTAVIVATHDRAVVDWADDRLDLGASRDR